MKFSEETLMAYADNELDSQTRSAVEAAMATDPEIARRIAQHKALRGRLKATFDEVLDEPPPQRVSQCPRHFVQTRALANRKQQRQSILIKIRAGRQIDSQEDHHNYPRHHVKAREHGAGHLPAG